MVSVMDSHNHQDKQFRPYHSEVECPAYEGVGLGIFDYLEWWDLDGLQAWAEVWAAKA
jgi:hypothetical protein